MLLPVIQIRPQVVPPGKFDILIGHSAYISRRVRSQWSTAVLRIKMLQENHLKLYQTIHMTMRAVNSVDV